MLFKIPQGFITILHGYLPHNRNPSQSLSSYSLSQDGFRHLLKLSDLASYILALYNTNRKSLPFSRPKAQAVCPELLEPIIGNVLELIPSEVLGHRER